MRLTSPAIKEVSEEEKAQNTMPVPGSTMSTPAQISPQANGDRTMKPTPATTADKTKVPNDAAEYLRACALVDTLAEFLDRHKLTSITKDPVRGPFRLLRSYCREFGLIPESYLIPSKSVSKVTDRPAGRGISEVFKGRYARPGGEPVDVAIKVLETTWSSTSDSSDALRKSICQEIILWQRLSQYGGITPMLGVVERPDEVWIISKWMEKGSLSKYLYDHRSDSSLNRLQLLVDACKGLKHLHSQGIAHGDIKSDNIVVDEKGRASLCDFGMTTFIHSLDSINPSTQSSTGGTMQYMAPELVNPEDCGLKYAHPSCECDIYAFAVVMWQVFSEKGEAPWKGLNNAQLISRAALRGVRPRRHSGPVALQWGLTDEVWKLIEHCWSQDWRKRPPVEEVLEHLKIALNAYNRGG
ncbi:kinase-like domain-containing protein [Fomitopsis betulina]|nr:kinase-like domain-containing protein [Fomitopsis betulina]